VRTAKARAGSAFLFFDRFFDWLCDRLESELLTAGGGFSHGSLEREHPDRDTVLVLE